MKKPLSKLITASLLTASLAGIVACKDKKPNVGGDSENSSLVDTSSTNDVQRKVFLVINGEPVEALVEDGLIKTPDMTKENKRFAGWSIDPDGASATFSSNDLYISVISLIVGGTEDITLYPIYADIAKVTFMLSTPQVFELDSLAMNIANVDVDDKINFDFLGWSLTENATEATIGHNIAITYEIVKEYLNSNASVTLYPVFVLHEVNINIHKYFVSEKMPEIRIDTAGGIAIDDKSLIDPTQKKGMNREIPVYNYVGATINVSSFGEGYDLVDAVGQVKVRGNYTSTYKKKPIRIKFDSKQKMLGLNNDNKLKSWVLLAEWKDPSLMRNTLADFLGNCLLESDGLYCTDFRYVKVYLNGEYNGVYVLAEQQQLNKYRVNVPESELETDGVNTGYMLEYDGYYKNEPAIQSFEVDYSRVKAGSKGFSVVNDIMNQAQHDYIAKAIQTIWDVIYDATKENHDDLSTKPYYTMDANCNKVVDRTIATAEEAVARVMDIKSLVNMYILHEICQDRDIGWSSFYFVIDLSEEGDRKLKFIAPWDFDYALGNNTYSNAQTGSLADRQAMINDGRLVRSGLSYKFADSALIIDTDFKFANTKYLYAKNTDNPWFTVFGNQEWFYRKVQQRWKDALKADVFEKASDMMTKLTKIQGAELQENFTAKWGEAMGKKIDQYQPDLITYFTTQKQAADYLKFWFEARVDGLTEAFTEEVNKYN